MRSKKKMLFQKSDIADAWLECQTPSTWMTQ